MSECFTAFCIRHAAGSDRSLEISSFGREGGRNGGPFFRSPTRNFSSDFSAIFQVSSDDVFFRFPSKLWTYGDQTLPLCHTDLRRGQVGGDLLKMTWLRGLTNSSDLCDLDLKQVVLKEPVVFCMARESRMRFFKSRRSKLYHAVVCLVVSYGCVTVGPENLDKSFFLMVNVVLMSKKCT